MNNEFVVDILARQRRDEMLAEAAADRLARQVPGGQGWWRRLSHQFSQTREPIGPIRRGRVGPALAK